MTVFVYKLTCTVNGKSYVGITTRKVRRRMICHKADAKFGAPSAISRAIAKHGWDAFQVVTLYEAASKAELLVAERGLIAAHGTMAPRGYNLTAGGDGCNSRMVSDEERKARSERAKKQHADGRFPGRKDYTVTPETRAKMSVAKLGWKPSMEMIKQARARWVGRGNPMCNPEINRRAADKRRVGKRTPEQRARIVAGVRGCKKTKLTWEAAQEIRGRLALGASHASVAIHYGVSRALVSMICAGKRWTTPISVNGAAP